MSEEATVVEELAPLSPEAIAARDKIREMVKELEEEERTRRVGESSPEEPQDQQKLATLDKLVTVQEDLIRFINLKKVRIIQSCIFIDICMHDIETILLHLIIISPKCSVLFCLTLKFFKKI